MLDARDVAWIQSVNCLKNCGMSIAEMKEYIQLCLVVESSLPERKVSATGNSQHVAKQLVKALNENGVSILDD